MMDRGLVEIRNTERGPHAFFTEAGAGPAAYGRYFESPVADLRNTPDGPPDTTIMAATYLREFPGDVPWVHIDNGSTAYLERPAGA